jgi:hypothetical protein
LLFSYSFDIIYIEGEKGDKKMTEIKLSEIKNFVEKRLWDLVEYDEETGTFSHFLEFLRENTLSNFRDFKNLEAEKLEKKGLYCANGVTKGVLIFNELDWVVKIPFRSNLFHSDTNYCERERFVYEQAKKRGVAEIFAESYFLMNFCGRPIYIMKKVEVNEEKVSTDLYNKGISEGCEEEDFQSIGPEEQVEELFYYYYEEDFLREYFAFCEDYEINDIHTSNIGYDENDKPVVIDYSGY